MPVEEMWLGPESSYVRVYPNKFQQGSRAALLHPDYEGLRELFRPVLPYPHNFVNLFARRRRRVVREAQTSQGCRIGIEIRRFARLDNGNIIIHVVGLDIGVVEGASVVPGEYPTGLRGPNYEQHPRRGRSRFDDNHTTREDDRVQRHTGDGEQHRRQHDDSVATAIEAHAARHCHRLSRLGPPPGRRRLHEYCVSAPGTLWHRNP